MAYKNKAEQHCAEMLTIDGWTLTKRGWPDFIAFKKDGSVIAIEVKAKETHKLSYFQVKVMSILHKAGIPCYRYCPSKGLTSFNPQIEWQKRQHR